MPKQSLGLPILISLVVGNMIGTGIYILPSSLAEYGTISLFSWPLTSLGAIFLALTLGQLNRSYPQTGGPYIYCRAAFGNLVGFVIAYLYWICNLASIAGIAVASVGYLGFITPLLNANTAQYQPYFALCIELCAVWFFICINMLGVRTAGILQLFLTVIKIAPLLLISLLGIKYIHLSNLMEFSTTPQSDFSAINGAAAMTLWAFVGLESATVPSENAKNTNTVFKATIIGTLIVAFIYILSTFVLMGMIPGSQLKSSQFPFAQAATLLFGPQAAILIALCAVISGFGTLNVTVLVQGQLVYAAARDQYMPRFLQKLYANYPIIGQIFSGILVSFFLILTVEPTLIKQFNAIALLTAFVTLITYFVTTLAQIRLLLATSTDLKNLYRNRSMLIAVVAFCYALWMLTNFDQKIIYLCLALIAFFISLYLMLQYNPLLMLYRRIRSTS